MLLPFNVNVPNPKETVPPVVPPPEREPICALNPFKSKPAPATFAMTTVEFKGRAFVAPA